tara:strand:- start:6005 stop:6373 length:369 start_codon:yes stop_codon:yes gene_type:complete
MIKLKKTLLWLKHYWYFPVVLIAIAVAFVIHRKKVEMMANLLIGSMESHKEKVEAIEAAEAKKAKKVQGAALKHSKELQKIISEESKALENAGQEKEERQKSLEELEVEVLADAMKDAFKKG